MRLSDFESVGFDIEASDAIFKDGDEIEEEVAEVDATEAKFSELVKNRELCPILRFLFIFKILRGRRGYVIFI